MAEEKNNYLDTQKAMRDSARQNVVSGEGEFVAPEDALEFGYVGYAADGVGHNDAATDSNSFGGNESTGPNASTPAHDKKDK